jgi:hypothetical protein
MTKKTKKKSRDPERHSSRCKVCKSPARAEIERKFCSWVAQAEIVREHCLGSRAVLHRHATAVGLFDRRDQNLRASLAGFIERGSRAKVTGAAFVQAVMAYSKIDSHGRTVDRFVNETGNGLRELFGRMTRGEMRCYAETGILPDWFKAALPGTPK